MARPKAKYKFEQFLVSLPPLMKARLDAHAEWALQQDLPEESKAVIIRSGLAMFFRENPLPEGYLEEYIKRNYKGEKQKDLLKQLEIHRKSNGDLY